jgi:hypothetical protein
MARFAEDVKAGAKVGDIEVRVGENGTVAAGALQHPGGVSWERLRQGVDVSIVFIDVNHPKIAPGFYRSRVTAQGPIGRMALIDAYGRTVFELDAKITTQPGGTTDAVCGTGVSSHVDPSGDVPTKTVCWAVTCSDSTSVTIITGCLVDVRP